MAEWFREWFGEEYLALYPHRDEDEAARLVALIRRTMPWRSGLRTLDVACGPGRHLRALEAAGARCTGVDLSMTLLRRARQGGCAPLVRADMRQLPIRPASMDLTVNLFTSFGYFLDDADHRTALAAMVGTVRPDGWFVMDFLNAPLVAREVAASAVGSGSGTAPAAGGAGVRGVQVARRLSEDDRYVLKTIVTADGREFLERVRLFSEADLAALLTDVGLDVQHRFGDYDGGPITDTSPRVILLGQPR